MADDLINLGASPTDAILGNSAISPDLLSQPLSPQTVQENQGQPMLPEPSISKAIQSLGIGLINGDQSGRGIAGGLADATQFYSGEEQRAQRNYLLQKQLENQGKRQQLAEYELLGRMRSRQLADAATLQKSATINKLKQENPEIADLIDLDPKEAAKALAAKANGTNTGSAALQSGLTGQPLLDALPPQDAANVKLIVDGKIDPKSFARSGKLPYYTALAAQVDPTFDATNYSKRSKVINAFNSGNESHTVNQLKTAINHGNELYDKVDKLHNLSGFPFVTYANAAKNFYQDKAGSTAVNDYNNLLGKYVDENTRVYLPGGGTEKDRSEAKEPLKDDRTTDQLKSAIPDSVRLMLGKMDALDDQYRQGTGTSLKYQFLSPKQRGILVKMNLVDPEEVGVDAGAANLPDDAPPPAPVPAPAPAAIDPNANAQPVQSSVFANSIGPVPQGAPAAMPAQVPMQGMLDDDPTDAGAATAEQSGADPDIQNLSDEDIQNLADKYQTTPDVVRQQLGL